MVVYSYNHQVRPPAPYLEAEVANPASGIAEGMPAKIDTGASISVVPERLVTDLELVPAGERLCWGYDGRSSVRTIYLGTVKVADVTFEEIELLAAPRADFLLGRDILNFCYTLNLRPAPRGELGRRQPCRGIRTHPLTSEQHAARPSSPCCWSCCPTWC